MITDIYYIFKSCLKVEEQIKQQQIILLQINNQYKISYLQEKINNFSPLMIKIKIKYKMSKIQKI